MPLMRGAIPSPRHLLAAAPSFVPRFAPPPKFGCIPKVLSAWGNHQYGDCVSAEEAAAKAMYSVYYGSGTELVIPDATLIQWARQHRFLNGAMLTDVMDAMIRDGIAVGGTTYHDGQYKSVDWTNDAVLSAAVYEGPVKIAVAANQLSNSYSESNGWWSLGYHQDRNTDHSINICGFGSLADLASMLGTTVPSKANPGDRGYLWFTWGSIGIVDRPSMIAITDEAWLRSPTTPETPQPSPVPVPPPGPGPAPDPNQPPSPVVIVTGPWDMTISWSVHNPTPPAPPSDLDLNVVPTPPAIS